MFVHVAPTKLFLGLVPFLDNWVFSLATGPKFVARFETCKQGSMFFPSKQPETGGFPT